MCFQEHTIGACGHFIFADVWVCSENPKIPGTEDCEYDPEACKNWMQAYRENKAFYTCNLPACIAIDWAACPYLPDADAEDKKGNYIKKQATGPENFKMSSAKTQEDGEKSTERNMGSGRSLGRGLGMASSKALGSSKSLCLESGNSRDMGLDRNLATGSTMDITLRSTNLSMGSSKGGETSSEVGSEDDEEDPRLSVRNSVSAQHCALKGIEIQNSRYDESDDDTETGGAILYPILLSIEEEEEY